MKSREPRDPESFIEISNDQMSLFVRKNMKFQNDVVSIEYFEYIGKKVLICRSVF
ncbi:MULTISPECIES: hypothetical protein [Aminobacterium]|uniref:hypothetical protein n=1 Tax=Aminobacterium TaxID=81466 RepID=UPI0004B6EC80|nr:MULTISPECIES: hypothetical protein [Aminobacterium]